MIKYKVEATLSGEPKAVRGFLEENDDQAVLKAIAIIMTRSGRDKRWAKGRIELYRGKNLLQVMDAKK